ncbi:MAG: NifB/NifX family molybdenum-iron cluster-binding protein [Candidatus Bathyarchaeia archaeon]
MRQDMLKIIIPVERFEGKDSFISNHFGRAPEFALVEISENRSLRNISPVKNVEEHFGGHGTAERIVSNLKPDIIIVKGMGREPCKSSKAWAYRFTQEIA